MSLELALSIAAWFVAAVVVILIAKAVARRGVRRALAARPMNDEALLAAVTAEQSIVTVTTVACTLGAIVCAPSAVLHVFPNVVLIGFAVVEVLILMVLGARSARLTELSRVAEGRGLALPGGSWGRFLAKGRV